MKEFWIDSISHGNPSQRMFIEYELIRLPHVVAKDGDIYLRSIWGMTQRLALSSIIGSNIIDGAWNGT